MLAALQKVPQLTYACLDSGCLSELRSISKAARQVALTHAAGLISGLTVDLERPFTTCHSQDLLSMLSATHPSRLCVGFQLENEGKQASPLKKGQKQAAIISDREVLNKLC